MEVFKEFDPSVDLLCVSLSFREIKVSTSTVVALFSKMALTSQRIFMVDMVLLVSPIFPISSVGVDGARISL